MKKIAFLFFALVIGIPSYSQTELTENEPTGYNFIFNPSTSKTEEFVNEPCIFKIEEIFGKDARITDVELVSWRYRDSVVTSNYFMVLKLSNNVKALYNSLYNRIDSYSEVLEVQVNAYTEENSSEVFPSDIRVFSRTSIIDKWQEHGNLLNLEAVSTDMKASFSFIMNEMYTDVLACPNDLFPKNESSASMHMLTTTIIMSIHSKKGSIIYEFDIETKKVIHVSLCFNEPVPKE